MTRVNKNCFQVTLVEKAHLGSISRPRPSFLGLGLWLWPQQSPWPQKPLPWCSFSTSVILKKIFIHTYLLHLFSQLVRTNLITKYYYWFANSFIVLKNLEGLGKSPAQFWKNLNYPFFSKVIGSYNKAHKKRNPDHSGLCWKCSTICFCLLEATCNRTM